MNIEELKICQSCGIPINREELMGTNTDGSKNNEYCNHCYENGAFSSNVTMTEFIEVCVPYVSKGNPHPNEEAARKFMQDSFPKLKRWKT